MLPDLHCDGDKEEIPFAVFWFPPTARTVLVIMQLMSCEPRSCLFPFGDPEATGDIIEAMLGICAPERAKDSAFSIGLAKNWGLTEDDLRELHARLEDLLD